MTEEEFEIDFDVEDMFKDWDEKMDTYCDRMKDPVNKPIHYNQSGIECIDAIEAMTEKMSGYLAPQAANVLKYMWRCEYKNGLEDIDKAIWYLNRLRKRWVETHK